MKLFFNSALIEQLKNCLAGEESFKNNDEKVLFYTAFLIFNLFFIIILN